jgi:hypothetical protein
VNASFGLFLGWFTVVLNVSTFEIAVEGFEVQEGRDVGVCGGTVVAFVEVIGEDLPVIVAYVTESAMVTDVRVVRESTYHQARKCGRVHSR